MSAVSRGRLRGQIVPAGSLDAAQVLELFSLYAANYDAADPARFAKDLRGKDHVVLLLDSVSGELRGFSTQKVFAAEGPDGGRVRVLFSGDTIIDPEYWGEQELVRGWCRYAGRRLAEEPGTPLYWLLISKGYRTYLYMPLFFEEHWPRHDRPTPPHEAALLSSLARREFGDSFDAEAGVLRFPQSLGHLKPALAAIPAARLEDPRVRFFLRKNARYAEGEELVCLARVGSEVMRGIAARAVAEGLSLGPLARPAREAARPPAGAACWT